MIKHVQKIQGNFKIFFFENAKKTLLQHFWEGNGNKNRFTVYDECFIYNIYLKKKIQKDLKYNFISEAFEQ